MGAAGSNYFAKYNDLDSVSLAFYKSWVWAFRGAVSRALIINILTWDKCVIKFSNVRNITV